MTDGYKINKVRIRQNGVEKIVRPSVPATAISLNKSSINLNTAGQTSQITATLTPADSTSSVAWTSSNTSIATVSSTGLVTCVTPGDCTITATTSNGLTATCSVKNSWAPGANTLAYYKFENNLNDSSGKGNNLSVYASPSYGTYNGKYYLSSGSGYRASLMPSVVTINFWFRSTNSSNKILIACYNNTNYDYNGRWDVLRLNDSPATISKRRVSSSSYTGPWTSTSYSDSQWHNACLINNSGSCSMYIDGVYKNSGSIGTTPSLLSVKCKDHYSVQGDVSNLIVENKAWSSQEILDFYNETKSGYGRS